MLRKFALVFAMAAVLAFSVSNAKAELVAQWTFDDSSNVGKATVGSDLTAVGGAAYTSSGHSGGALSLDGSTGYLHLDGDALPTGVPAGHNSYTITAWIKTSNYGEGYIGANSIVGWGSYGTDGGVNAFRTNRGIDSGDGLTDYSWGPNYDIVRYGTVSDGVWHFAAVTYDSSTNTKQLYLNGNTLGLPMTMPEGGLDIGAGSFRVGSTNSGGEFCNGLLDDVRIYNTALTSGEIATIAGVPEPSSLLLIISGLIGLLAYAWQKRK